MNLFACLSCGLPLTCFHTIRRQNAGNSCVRSCFPFHVIKFKRSSGCLFPNLKYYNRLQLTCVPTNLWPKTGNLKAFHDIRNSEELLKLSKVNWFICSLRFCFMLVILCLSLKTSFKFQKVANSVKVMKECPFLRLQWVTSVNKLFHLIFSWSSQYLSFGCLEWSVLFKLALSPFKLLNMSCVLLFVGLPRMHRTVEWVANHKGCISQLKLRWHWLEFATHSSGEISSNNYVIVTYVEILMKNRKRERSLAPFLSLNTPLTSQFICYWFPLSFMCP